MTWEIVYFNFLPDFGDKYTAYVIEKARASGASAEEIARQTEEMNNFKTCTTILSSMPPSLSSNHFRSESR